MSLFSVLLRTIARETAFQIALRNCSKEVRREVSIHVIFVKRVHAIIHLSIRLPLAMRNRYPS